MAKPILSNITVFDGTKGTTINFLLYGKADTVTWYVHDNETGNQVATGTAEVTGIMANRSFEFPAGKLTNKLYPYFMRIKTSYQLEETELSDPVLFYCKTEPKLSFAGLIVSTPNTINTSSYLFELNYENNTSEGESLNSYQYHLYDSNKDVLMESKEYYGDIANSFPVDGFANNAIYYIRGTGTSINGYEFDTGYITLQVSYNVELNRALLNVENDYPNGVVNVESTIAFMDGVSIGDIEYVQIGGENYAADLTDGSIAYTIPYTVEAYTTTEFAIKITVKPQIYENVVVVTAGNNNYFVSTNIRAFTDLPDDTTEKYFVILKGDGYVQESNYIAVPDDDKFIDIYIVNQSGIFSVYVKESDSNAVVGGE